MNVLRRIASFYLDAFRGLPRLVWQLSLGLLVNRAGTMVLPFLGLYLVQELEFSTRATSAVLFAFGLGSVVGSYLGGVLVGRFTSTQVQLASLVLAGLGFLGLSRLDSLPALVVGVFVVGAVADAYRPACMTAIVEASPLEVQARCMGLMRLAANSGMAIGPALGGWLATIDYRLIFIGDGLTCLVAAAWLYRVLRKPSASTVAPPERSSSTAGSLWRDGRFLSLLGVIFFAALVLFQIFGALPLYLAVDYRLNEGQIGLVFAFNALLIVVFEMVLIKLLERRNPGMVLAMGLFLMCFGFSLLPLGDSLMFAACTVVVWTLGEMLAFPFSNILVAKLAGPARTGRAMGMYTAMFAVASVVAPVAGLQTLDRYGGDVLWMAAGVLGLLVGILTAALARSFEPGPRRAGSEA
ncbi:MAG: MFS transporter [Acidobacteriota bacterium]